MISKMNYKSFLGIRQKQLALARMAVGTKKIIKMNYQNKNIVEAVVHLDTGPQVKAPGRGQAVARVALKLLLQHVVPRVGDEVHTKIQINIRV